MVTEKGRGCAGKSRTQEGPDFRPNSELEKRLYIEYGKHPVLQLSRKAFVEWCELHAPRVLVGDEKVALRKLRRRLLACKYASNTRLKRLRDAKEKKLKITLLNEDNARLRRKLTELETTTAQLKARLAKIRKNQAETNKMAVTRQETTDTIEGIEFFSRASVMHCTNDTDCVFV